MTDEEVLEAVIQASQGRGPYPMGDLLAEARGLTASGVAVAQEKGQKWYLLFLAGEPEGAILADRKGNLYGNKAVYLLKGSEQFLFYEANPEVVDRIVLICRVFDKRALARRLAGEIPEMTRKVEGGVGTFSMQVTRNGLPVPRYSVTIRKGGQVVGSDMTSDEGKVSFRLLFGRYECVISDRSFSNQVYEFEFSADLQNRTVTLDIA